MYEFYQEVAWGLLKNKFRKLGKSILDIELTNIETCSRILRELKNLSYMEFP